MGYGVSSLFMCTLTHLSPKVEDKFSPYGKETLAKVIKFLEVSNFGHTQ